MQPVGMLVLQLLYGIICVVNPLGDVDLRHCALSCNHCIQSWHPASSNMRQTPHVEHGHIFNLVFSVAFKRHGTRCTDIKLNVTKQGNSFLNHTSDDASHSQH